MKTITISIPEETPVIKIIQGMAAMGYSIRWKNHNHIEGKEKFKCESCRDSGFQSVGEVPTLCHCRVNEVTECRVYEIDQHPDYEYESHPSDYGHHGFDSWDDFDRQCDAMEEGCEDF